MPESALSFYKILKISGEQNYYIHSTYIPHIGCKKSWLFQNLNYQSQGF